jgi:hypothetical protein
MEKNNKEEFNNKTNFDLKYTSPELEFLKQAKTLAIKYQEIYNEMNLDEMSSKEK